MHLLPRVDGGALRQVGRHRVGGRLGVGELCERMLAWHTAAGIEEMEEGNIKSAVFWERDAGKFQAMLNILSSVSMGNNDFLMR